MNIDNVKKILVIQVAGIGDMVTVLPSLKALRERYRNAFIGLMVIRRSAELIKGSRYIDKLFVFDSRSASVIGMLMDGSFIRVLKVMGELRREKFDMVINLENISSFLGAIKMAVIFWLIGAKYKAGRDTDGRGFFLNLKVKENSKENKHQVQINLDVVRLLGAVSPDTRVELPIFDDDKKFVSDFLSKNKISDKDFIVGLNPGSYRQSRRWFDNFWAELADRLIKEYGYKVIIIGYRTESDMVDNIINLMKEKTALTATSLNLKQLAVLIKRFNLFVTNDSGPMHIATSLGTALVALFGPSDTYKFLPSYGEGKYQVIQKEVDCSRPCYKVSCKNRICMERITVSDVLGAIRRILG